jgi:hypothetical protein
MLPTLNATREGYAVPSCPQKSHDLCYRNEARDPPLNPNAAAAYSLLREWVGSLRSASGAEDFDREDQAVALLDPRLGLAVGVAVR